MPKNQVSVKPQSFATFGELLRYLRERNHLSQRDLAALVGYHYSYMSYLEKNMRVPDEASLLGRFIPALGLEDEPELAERLLELARDRQKKSILPQREAEPAISEENASQLPTSLTVILGREREAASLEKLLSRPEVRLATIVGPPGVGKTRLALHVAEQAEKNFTHGVIFVNLTPVIQMELVLPAIAAA
jgi:transcriptional regulator with XRE-family HTH domain